MKKLTLLIVFTLAICNFAFAQTPLADLDKIKRIKLLESTREDIKKIFGDDDEESEGDSYSTENMDIDFSYSNGDCPGEDEDEEWNVPEGKVIEISVILRDSEKDQDSDKAKALMIDLSKLERINKNDDEDTEEEEEDPDDFVYYDKEKGISYGLSDGELKNIKFTPLEKNSPALCSNENLRNLGSTKEWFLEKIKHRPYSGGGERGFANVNSVTLSKNELIADCPEDDASKIENDFDYFRIAIEANAASGDPTDILTYNYTVSGGEIIGTGASVTWDLSGVKPGKYTITAGVDNGCGVCGSTKTEEVVVKERPDCSQKKK